jgi:hypothetical protein
MTALLPASGTNTGYADMGIPFAEIISIMRQRLMMDAQMLKQMIEVRDRVNGDVVIPLVDVTGSPVMDPPNPRYLMQAVDSYAMLACSTSPRITCPPEDPLSTRARKQAETRRRALYARHESSAMDVKNLRLYRHFFAYGTECIVVMPDEVRGHANIEIRDPLTAYPELRDANDIREPRNCGFVFGRSIDWIITHYPEAKDWLKTAAGRSWDTLWDLVEWIDDQVVVVGIMGPRQPAYAPQEQKAYGYSGFELRRWRNLAGMVPVACPRRVTLDRVMGQVTGLVGMVDLHAKLTALNLVSMEKAIFPDMVAVSKTGAPPTLIGGQWKDGRTGEINLISESVVQVLQAAPGPATQQALDRLDASIRMSGAGSSILAGETGGAGSLRTGNAINALGSYSTDPRVQEAQTIHARTLTVVNDALMAVEVGYFPKKKYVTISGIPGEDDPVIYTPADAFAFPKNKVAYPFPGADINEISVAVSQLVGGELISKRTARAMHPLIADGSQEEELIESENIREAVSQAFLQGCVQGQIPPHVAARVDEMVRGGKTLYQAIIAAEQEEQGRQAAMQQQQTPTPSPMAGGLPGGNPNAGPGGGGPMGAPPGMPGTAPGVPIPPPPQGQVNLRHMLQGLNENISPGAV